jgi:hypothetical protein
LGIFVAVAYTSASYGAAYSADGKNWITAGVNLPVSTNWISATWSPQLGIFVAVAQASVYGAAYSTDGKTWVTAGVNLPVSTPWRSITWSPQLGIFVAVALGSGSYGAAYSTDGKTWVTAGVNLPVSTLWYSVTWSPQLGIFVAVNSSASYGAAYSTDGKTWITAGVNLPVSTPWYSVTWSPQLGIFVAVAYNSASYGAAYSSGPGLQQGTCLLTNGNVLAPSPGTANVIQFDPVSLTASNIVLGTDGYSSLTLAPNGNVIGTPMNSNIIVINPSTSVSSNITVPSPNTQTQTSFGGACLLPSGNIIFAPSLTITANVGSSNVGMFDPSAMVYSNSTASGGNFSSATLIPSGQVVFCPSGSANVGLLDTMTPAPPEWCLSPYFNKF